ncbi:electron transport complex subunit RsxC [Petroclostridium sp. X23]|uniref:electron transport complex subunit RsxC n=1 Tax=Petroclostridium sp. X23 TaxID=3045146 RepID=UPI0024ACF474|nr:electron transport complex subunit RsxC [Petroclostridium sp. X23]WHH59994.1 electron transport complex subunit RsxC [Petroclostridium sp. X23]
MKERLLSFKGGIHPDYCKELTRNKEVIIARVPQVAEIPLVQHIGAPATAIVKVGDHIKMGQKIGQANGMISAHIHSSVSGKVLSIEPRAQVGGIVPTVIIENDGEDELDEIIVGKSIEQLSSKQIIEIVQEAGVVGMGGATFPSHVKLCPPPDHKIDTVIVNGAECEPYLNSDYRLMTEQPEMVLYGLKAVLKALNVERGYIGIEDNKPKAIKVLRDLCKNENSIEVEVLETKYPQGGEKQLIKAVTGREVPSKKLPSQIGCVIFNAGTTAAIARAVKTGLPLIERIVTITGKGIKEPKNLLVRIGTTFKEVIEQCGGLKDGYAKVISGGPMMGIAQGSLDVAVIKGTSGILALMKDEMTEVNPYPCIKCARCVDVCPIGLLPIKIANAVQAGDLDTAMQLNLMDCIECGSCSYTCPAKRPLLQYIRLGKSKVRSKQH